LPVDQARPLAMRFPRSRLEIFEKCGHLPQLEHADKFNQLVQTMLKS